MDREKIITAAELMDMQFLPVPRWWTGCSPPGATSGGSPQGGQVLPHGPAVLVCGYRDPLPGTAHPPLPGAVSVSGGHGGARPGQADPDVRCGAPSGTPPSEIWNRPAWERPAGDAGGLLHGSPKCPPRCHRHLPAGAGRAAALSTATRATMRRSAPSRNLPTSTTWR